jgi:hypothetical protein
MCHVCITHGSRLYVNIKTLAHISRLNLLRVKIDQVSPFNSRFMIIEM